MRQGTKKQNQMLTPSTANGNALVHVIIQILYE